MKTLVLGLGNDLLGDDGVGILAARALKERLVGQADVVESSLSGLALLDILIGYDRALLIDAVRTGVSPPGTISELIPADLGSTIGVSPHYAGLPELLALADELDLNFPKEIKILLVEVAGPYTVGENLSETVKKALPDLIERAVVHVQPWCGHRARG